MTTVSSLPSEEHLGWIGARNAAEIISHNRFHTRDLLEVGGGHKKNHLCLGVGTKERETER